jgi:ABC-type Fe3+/spermidine/putrescine transport system ATPase subunit
MSTQLSAAVTAPDIASPGRGEPLSVIGVRKRYGDFTAIDSVSLDVPAGALLTLLGPSGCGKSTLLRLIAGFVTADEGRVTLGDRDVLGVAPHRRDTAMVFQSYALFPHMDVLTNVMFGLKMRRVPAAEARKRALEALEMVRLSALAGRYPAQLSGGQQQRAALARALVTQPKVLLLDEPFGALDKSLRDQMQVELRKLQRAVGVTTICVTHDQQEAMAISDRIAVMNAGRIEQCGAPADIYDRPATRFVAQFIGTSNTVTGTLAFMEGQRGVLNLPEGGRLSVSGIAERRVGDAVDVTIRPGAIRLAAAGTTRTTAQSGSHLAGRIALAMNLGDKVTYEVESHGLRLTVDAPRHAGEPVFPEGAPVEISIAVADCMVLRA